MNGVESVERRLNVKLERGTTADFFFCTPLDENLGELKLVELHQRSKDAWYMDKVTLIGRLKNYITLHIDLCLLLTIKS